MTALPDLFPGFETRRIDIGALALHVRIGGQGPPLLLLHGYPQTHVCWHRVAPDLARRFRLVIPDLRGYGASDCPPDGDGHMAYSKRAMAEDALRLMRTLGHERFAVVAHDRGARAAFRLALEHPDRVDRLALLDILPTLDVWEGLTAESALAAYHWSFLAQPAPMPERLIGADPAFYVDHTLASWTAGRSLAPFSVTALAHYRAQLGDPARVHAVCEDYRAGATIDRRHDAEDRSHGRRIACPTLALWGSGYMGRGSRSPLDVWRAWAENVVGGELACGHFLAEESSEATLAALFDFLPDAERIG